MLWAGRIIAGLWVMTYGYAWTVGQSGLSIVDHNLCELWDAVLWRTAECQPHQFLLPVWTIGAICAAAFLVIDFVRVRHQAGRPKLETFLWVILVIGLGASAASAVGLWRMHSVNLVSEGPPPIPTALPTPTIYPTFTSPAATALMKEMIDHPPPMSPELVELTARKETLWPIVQKYMTTHPRGTNLRSPDAIAFYNKGLQEAGISWRVTSENIDMLAGNVVFGNKIFNSKGDHPSISLHGSKGNFFDQTEIHTPGTAIELKDSDKNQFRNTQINPPDAPNK
jgi:hypothetical protein